MPEIILVNPSARPSRRKKNPSPAQKRARANFAKMARARAKGANVMSNPKRRRRNPAKRRTRRSNPRAITTVSRNPARRRHHRRRNPIGVGGRKPGELLMPALVGALGAAGVNTLLANLGSALPASLLAGNMQFITRAVLSIGVGMIGRKSGRSNIWQQAAEGSLTVTFHDAIVSLGGGSLAGMGAYMPGRTAQVVPVAGQRPAQQLNGMGAYLTGTGSAKARQVIAARQAQIATSGRRMAGFGF